MVEISWHRQETRRQQRKQTSTYSIGRNLPTRQIQADRTFDLSAFRSLFRSELSVPRARAVSTRLVTAEASIPRASARSRFLIPCSRPNIITASLTATVLRFLLLLHSSCRVSPLERSAALSRSSI